jgi:hypothetical protein
MKPKPFSPLNHLTVPVDTNIPSSLPGSNVAPIAGQGR